MAEDARAPAGGGEVPKGRAKQRGDGSPALTAAEKALRDAAIISSLHAGVEQREIAKEFGITPRSVRRVREQFELRRTALDDQPMQIVERTLREHEQQMRMFRMVAFDTIERAPAVAIAALKGYTDSLEKHTQLLADVGLLPENLKLFRSEGEMRRVGELMFEKMRQVESGEISVAEAGEFFRSVVTSRVPLATYDAPEGSVAELEPGGEQ